MLDTLTKREWRRRAMKIFRGTLATLGMAMPLNTKIKLARRSTKWGYLLHRAGDFRFDEYLGDVHVNINTRYSAERVMLTGAYENDLRYAIDRYVSPGDYCLDIGANVGAVSLSLAQKVGPEGKVFCFEPGPVFFERLQKNIALNPELNQIAMAFNLGVSDKPGKLHWAEDPDFPGNAFLFGKQGISVDVVTLDDLILPNVDKIDFVKIDVEGMELEVLTGARGLLQKFQPVVFFESSMEFEVYRQRPVRRLAAEMLKDLGYRLFHITESGKLEAATYPDFAPNTLALPLR